MGSVLLPPQAAPPPSSPDRPPLHRCERTSPVKNRMREICTSGTVRGEAGNILTYSAVSVSRRHLRNTFENLTALLRPNVCNTRSDIERGTTPRHLVYTQNWKN